MTRAALRFQPRAGLIGLVSAIILLTAVWQGPGPLGTGLGVVGGTMLALVALIYFLTSSFRLTSRRARRNIEEFVSLDAAPCFVTDDEGALWYVNAAAEKRFKDGAVTLSELLGDIFVNPQAVVFRLRKRAEIGGAAREDVITRRGHVRLTIHKVGEQDYLWRLEEIADRQGGGTDKSFLPSITVGRRGTILFMNEASRRLVGERLKRLDQLFGPEPLRSGTLREIHTTSGRRTCFVTQVELQGGRQEIFLMPAADSTSRAQDAPAQIGAMPWSAIEALPVPMLKVAPGGEILSSNQLARDLLGRGDVRGARLSALMEGLGRPVGDWVREVAAGRGTKHSEFLRVTREDKEVFVQVSLKLATARVGDRPSIEGVEAPAPEDAEERVVLAVLSDATELKTLEAQFVQSQKMQAIGQLAGGVAHDFNNLLTAISGHCDLLLLRHDQADQDFEDLTQIAQNANRAAALVGQLLAFSRKQTLRLEKLDLRETLSDLAHLLNRLVGAKVRLNLLHGADLRVLRADKRQLEQVVMNLVVNARDAMPEGGEIEIATRNMHLKSPMERDRATVPAGEYVTVTVKDQGTGIPSDKLQKIFEPFYTTKRPGEGTGLGLSTAYGIVKQSGGYIFCDSVPDEGTTFTLLFPVREEADEDAAVEAQTNGRRPPTNKLAPDPQQTSRPGAGSEAQGAQGGAEPVSADPDRAPTPAATSDAPPEDTPAAADPVLSAEKDGPAVADPVLSAERDGPAVADEVLPDVGVTAEALQPSDSEIMKVVRSTLGPVAAEDAIPRSAEAGSGDRESVPTGSAGHRERSRLGNAGRSYGSKVPSANGGQPRAEGMDRVILLVEDEAPVRAFASRALRMRGFTVLEAVSAEDALRTLDETDLNVDIFVTDVVMPGMDGPSWVRKALEKRPDTRVVFVSGYAEESFAEGQTAIPNSVFLPKPFSLSELTDTVKKQLH